MRRRSKNITEIGATIAVCYFIFYGFTNNWAFQYLAWSLPFWFFLRPVVFWGSSFFASGYIYSMYSFLCGNFWLLGSWNLMGHTRFSPVVMFFRNFSFLFFIIAACVFICSAIYRQIDSKYQLK
jgi:uncharacterized membrane protein